MSLLIDLPLDVERRLRERVPLGNGSIDGFVIQAIRDGLDRLGENVRTSNPEDGLDEVDSSPWRGVCPITIPFESLFPQAASIELTAIPDWPPHIAISPRWTDHESDRTMFHPR